MRIKCGPLRGLYVCDPTKNTECPKTHCRLYGGECYCTKNKDFELTETKVVSKEREQ
jgi:hypothetical protein